MMHPTALQIEDVNDVIFFYRFSFFKKNLVICHGEIKGNYQAWFIS